MKKNTGYYNTQPLEDFNWDLHDTRKHNASVKLTDKDKLEHRKILCSEPYAQDLYDKMVAWENKVGEDFSFVKDLELNKLYDVRATSICFNTTSLRAVEKYSNIEVTIPFKEYTGDLDSLTRGDEEAMNFKVILYKSNGNCEYYASERKSRTINYKDELLSNLKQSKWFEVNIKSLIKGGYIATYKNEIDCFIPGSQAGANVIKDFSILLGKTINVMVDNYDSSNNLFILSHKKYIKHSLPSKISNLRFGKEYSGRLTTKPYDFGMFIELDGYYTGLLHSSEFKDYNTIKRDMRAGDIVNVYVKGVSMKKKEYRIMLTLDREKIPAETLQWDDLKESIEGNDFDFSVNEFDQNMIDIYMNGDSIQLKLSDIYLDTDLSTFSKITIHKVNVLEKAIKYTLIS